MSHMMFLNFTKIQEHCISLKESSHVTYDVLKFVKIQEHCVSLKRPSNVTYGVQDVQDFMLAISD